MKIWAIDPGYEQSALVALCDDGVVAGEILPNHEGISRLRYASCGRPLVIEQIQSYGMAVGKTVFETVYWSGRFAEAWEGNGGEVYRLPRRDVKLHLCGQAKAKDANIRQALIDRFGPSKEQAIGKKVTPGPLYGFKSDMWAALAVAVTWADQNPRHDNVVSIYDVSHGT